MKWPNIFNHDECWTSKKKITPSHKLSMNIIQYQMTHHFTAHIVLTDGQWCAPVFYMLFVLWSSLTQLNWRVVLLCVFFRTKMSRSFFYYRHEKYVIIPQPNLTIRLCVFCRSLPGAIHSYGVRNWITFIFRWIIRGSIQWFGANEGLPALSAILSR